MKLDMELDMELDMKLDMKTSHGRAREEREACAREEDEVQTGARSGLTGRHAGAPGPSPGLTGRHAGAPGPRPGPTGSHAGSARSRPDPQPVHTGPLPGFLDPYSSQDPIPGPVSIGPSGPRSGQPDP